MKSHYYYKDKKYFLAIQDYKNGNSSSVQAICNMMIQKQTPKFDEDVNQFIYEVQKSTTCLAVFSHLPLIQPHQPRHTGCFIGFPDRHAIGLHDSAVVGLVGFENLIFP